MVSHTITSVICPTSACFSPCLSLYCTCYILVIQRASFEYIKVVKK